MLAAQFKQREVVSVEDIVGIVAGVIGLLGYVPYVISIRRGCAEPECTSWFIWLLEYIALFLAQLQKGASSSLWIIGLQLPVVAIIFVLSMMSGLGQAPHVLRAIFHKLHKIIREEAKLFLCILVALVAWFFVEASIAVVILIAVEASGAVLTIQKVYYKPGSEALSTWSCIGVAGFLGIFSVKSGSPVILYAYPVSLVVMNFGVVIASLLGAQNNKRQSLTTAM